jgi:hypothetical protein
MLIIMGALGDKSRSGRVIGIGGGAIKSIRLTILIMLGALGDKTRSGIIKGICGGATKSIRSIIMIITGALGSRVDKTRPDRVLSD